MVLNSIELDWTWSAYEQPISVKLLFSINCQLKLFWPTVQCVAVHFWRSQLSFPGRWRWGRGELCSTEFLFAPETADWEGAATHPPKHSVDQLKKPLTLLNHFFHSRKDFFLWSCCIFTMIDVFRKVSIAAIIWPWCWRITMRLIQFKFRYLSAWLWAVKFYWIKWKKFHVLYKILTFFAHLMNSRLSCHLFSVGKFSDCKTLFSLDHIKNKIYSNSDTLGFITFPTESHCFSLRRWRILFIQHTTTM